MFQRFRYFCSLVTFFRRKHVRALDAQQLFSLNFYFAVYCSCSHSRRKCSCFKLIKISGLLADLMRVRPYGTPLVAQTAKHLLQCGRPGFEPWVGKIPWRRKWQPTPVLLPGTSHGWRILVGYSSWGRKESDTTERIHFHFLSLYESEVKTCK